MPQNIKQEINLSKEEKEHIALLLEEYLFQGGNIRGIDSDVLSAILTKLQA